MGKAYCNRCGIPHGPGRCLRNEETEEEMWARRKKMVEDMRSAPQVECNTIRIFPCFRCGEPGSTLSQTLCPSCRVETPADDLRSRLITALIDAANRDDVPKLIIGIDTNELRVTWKK